MAYTYILFSTSKNRFYTGCTTDLQKRVERHNSGINPSTKYGIPWTLVWHQKCTTLSEARALEINIKRRGAKRFLDDLKS